MSARCLVYRLGLAPYQEAWDLQGNLAGQIARGEQPPTLLLCEHPHTFTFGRRGQASNLLWDAQELARRGVEVHWVDRGGDVTYHGPGQLVGYPLLPLGRPELPSTSPPASSLRIPQADYVGYIRRLEQVIIQTLARFGVASERLAGKTGVWVWPEGIPPSGGPLKPGLEFGSVSQPAKIAAIGVKVDVHGISRHGLALNVDPDMSYWHGIIACGLAEHPSASLAEMLKLTPPLSDVEQALIEAFGEQFNYQMVDAKLANLAVRGSAP
jgi:lipoate-protein ligase B